MCFACAVAIPSDKSQWISLLHLVDCCLTNFESLAYKGIYLFFFFLQVIDLKGKMKERFKLVTFTS